MFYSSMVISSESMSALLPFFIYNLASVKQLIKHVCLQFSVEAYPPAPTIRWTTALPNLKNVELAAKELHAWDDKDFAIFTSTERLVRGRQWLDSFPDLLQQCRAPGRTFNLAVRIKSMAFSEYLDVSGIYDTDPYRGVGRLGPLGGRSSANQLQTLRFDVDEVLSKTSTEEQLDVESIYPNILQYG
jgi:hypothetical protein